MTPNRKTVGFKNFVGNPGLVPIRLLLWTTQLAHATAACLENVSMGRDVRKAYREAITRPDPSGELARLALVKLRARQAFLFKADPTGFSCYVMAQMTRQLERMLIQKTLKHDQP